MNKKVFVVLMLLWLAFRAAASAYYDPHTQSFLSRDPIREAGGVNLYAYCGNDPVGNYDPIGLAEIFGAGLDANGNPQVHYWDWNNWWGSLVGGATHTWWQAPSSAELARLFRPVGGGGWRLASESERQDVFWQQFNTSLPGAMQNAGQSFDAFAKLNGGAFAAVSGVGLLAEGGLTLGTGIVVGHEAWFAGSSWTSLATGNNYPLTPEGALAQASGASGNAVNATDALVSSGVPFLAGRGPLLRVPGPEWNPLNYRLVDVGVGMNGGNVGIRYRGPISPFPRDSLNGVSLGWLQRNKPRGWITEATERNEGWIWRDEAGIERLRFMRPNGLSPANSRWSRQANGYFRWQNANGNFLDINGNVVLPSDPQFQELTHIMYEGPQ